jgi:hypothetical protein
MTAMGARKRLATFDALRDTNYRWYWLAMLASSSTMPMGRVGQGWLVYELTGSAFALGWVSAGWSISNSILSPWGGDHGPDRKTRVIVLVPGHPFSSRRATNTPPRAGKAASPSRTVVIW